MNIRHIFLGVMTLFLLQFSGLAQQLPRLVQHPVLEGLSESQSAKIGNHLQSVYLDFINQGTDLKGMQEVNMDQFVIHKTKVRITALAISSGEELASQLKGLGATEVSMRKRTIDAWLDINKVLELAKLSSLQYAEVVVKPSTNIGSVDSEADSAMVVKATRNSYNLDGSGVKIGVLSDSYDANSGAAGTVLLGDLPGPGNPNGYTTGVTVVKDLVSGSDEGRAMCELIHDLAPGAALYSNTAFLGPTTFANDIINLANTYGCDVIVDDIRYFEEPFYMDGEIAQACDQVFSQGVSYFSSAGNYAQASYEAAFTPTPNGRFHDFDPGPGVDTMQSITVSANSRINLVLQWHDPWGNITSNNPNTDLDLYIYDASGTGILNFSVDDQGVTTIPSELIVRTAPSGGTFTFNIAIRRYSGPTPAVLKWVLVGASGLSINEYASTTVNGQSTGFGHSNAAGANAVGACAWFQSPAYGVNPPLAEPFTSSGGVQIRFDINGNAITPTTRNKPEFTANDGISNTFFGGGSNNFFGTSAAAPNAAAVACLMKEANPTISPSEIRSFLAASAIDMNTLGFDFLTGAGLIQADAAMRTLYDSLCDIIDISVDSSPTLDAGGSTYHVGIKVKFTGAISGDSLIVNGISFLVTSTDSQTVVLSGLPANGQPYNVTASLQKTAGCSKTEASLFIAPSIPVADTLVITEIMYNPPESGTDSLEFIEIHNPTSTAINLNGYEFTQGISHTFGAVNIPAGGYVVVAKSSSAMLSQFGVNAIQWNSGVLTNTGEDIVLKDSYGNTVDSVDYDNSSPWPSGADGDGPSIVLCDPTLDNNVGTNWQVSSSATGKVVNGYALYGSPGASDNACSPCPVLDSTFVTQITCDSTQAGTVVQILTGSDGCDSIVTTTTVFDPETLTALANVTICEGDSVLIFGNYQSMEKLYRDTVPNQNGCDSILVQRLIVNPIDSTFLNTTTSDSTMAGVFVQVLTGSNSCDSVVITTVVYVPIPCVNDTTYQSAVTCDSTLAGITYQTLAGSDGCDSILVTTATYDPGNNSSLPAMSICEGDSLMIFGVYQKAAGVYYDTLKNMNGCDSIVSKMLSLNMLDTVYESSVTNDPGQAGVFSQTYTNQDGCDSTVITTVTYVPPISLDTLVITEIMYNPPESGTDSLEFIEIHNPTSTAINLNGYEFTQGISHTFGAVNIPAGGYIVVAKSSSAMLSQFGVSVIQWASGSLINGGEGIVLKDSLGRTIDSVNYDNSNPWPSGADGDGPSIVLCDPLVDNNDGVNWQVSTTASGKVINGFALFGSPGAADNACSPCLITDSTFVNQVTCDSSLAGTAVQVLMGSDGCDSVVTTTTMYDPGNMQMLSDAIICKGDSALIFGAYQTSAGTYMSVLSNQNGCDSILKQTLVVNPIDSTFINTTTSDSTLAGVFVQVLTGSNSCDSIVITTVIYVPIPCVNDTTHLSAISCDSSLAGISYQTLAGSDGCDSIIVTTTTYDPGSVTVLPLVEICDGDTAIVFGQVVTLAGTYYDTLYNQNGCDSISQVTVMVNPTFSISAVDSICPGDSIYVGGGYQSIPGVYLDVLSSLKGCDSLLYTSVYYKDTSDCNGGPIPSIFSLVSDSSWALSTVVTTATANKYPWPGVASVPTVPTFSLPALVGQPYPWVHIYTVPGSQVIKSGSGVTYYRKTFDLADNIGLNARFRMFVDDDMQIFINGKWIALEDGMGKMNYRTANHDILFKDDGSVDNGHSGGDPFDFYTAMSLDSIFQIGSNDVVLAIRNRTSKPDKGGFSFRMDLDKAGQPVIVGKAATATPGLVQGEIPQIVIYPNPTVGIINILSENILEGEVLDVHLFDVTGKLLLTTKMTYSTAGQNQLDLSGFAGGVYSLRIKSGRTEITKPIMLK